jgi:hypothetical protein
MHMLVAEVKVRSLGRVADGVARPRQVASQLGCQVAQPGHGRTASRLSFRHVGVPRESRTRVSREVFPVKIYAIQVVLLHDPGQYCCQHLNART